MAAARLQLEHHRGELVRVDLAAGSPRWLISQFWQNTQRRLHQPKKIVPEPRRPRSGALLAVVRAVAGDDRPRAGPADRAPDGRVAVHPAVARAQVAGREMLVGEASPLGQLAGPPEPQVGGLEACRRHHLGARPGVTPPGGSGRARGPRRRP